jgi:hypothetical protein
MTRTEGVPAEPPRTLRTPSDISDARAHRAARLVALARRRRQPFDQVRAMAIGLSRQRDITVDEAIDVLVADAIDAPWHDRNGAPRARREES